MRSGSPLSCPSRVMSHPFDQRLLRKSTAPQKSSNARCTSQRWVWSTSVTLPWIKQTFLHMTEERLLGPRMKNGWTSVTTSYPMFAYPAGTQQVFFGAATPRGPTPTPYPFIYHFGEKMNSLCVPFIDKWYPSHITTFASLSTAVNELSFRDE